jgi:DNA-binding response OmpR family regulator
MSATKKIQPSKVIVVEGYLSQSRSILSHLDDLGEALRVVSAQDAEAGLAQMDNEPVDLVIVDVNLKGKMDGFDLCKSIRASLTHQEVPIILLLGGHLSLERSKGILSGADLMLHRPVVKEELFKMVRLLLEWSAGQQAKTEGQRLHRLRSVR